MSDRYAYARSRIAARAKQYNTGAVTLTRATVAASEEDTPWIPGEPTLDVYTLDAVVSDVAAEYIDGTLTQASHQMIAASPRARHTESDGEPVEDTPVVDIVPLLSDIIEIDGAAKAIIRIVPAPSAGAAAVFQIFVAA